MRLDNTKVKGSRKTLVLGLDGATFDIIDPLMARGELPHFQKLIEDGCALELLSTIHPYSAQAWSSFMTGMNAGKHGILDFTEHVKQEYRLKFLNSSFRQGATLWRILSDHGKKVGVVNMPFTYPPEAVDGFVVSGMDAPSVKSDFTYPKNLKDEILGKLGGYVIELGVKDHIARGHPLRFLEEMERAFDLQMAALEYLMTEKPWDFFVYVFRVTDQVQHYFWKYFDPHHPLYDKHADQRLKDAIPEIYRKIDRALGDMLNRLPKDTDVVIMSDHGQGGINGKTVLLNNWLASEGFLHFGQRGPRMGNGMLKMVPRGKKAGLINFIRRTIPKRVRTSLVKSAPGLKDKLISHGLFENIDWPKTQAYSDEKRANIWINVKGIQGEGIVAPGQEYERVRDTIIAKLADMKDPQTGEPIFVDIYKKEDLYSGPYMDRAPDILFTQGKRKYYYVLQRSNGKESSWIKDLDPEVLRTRTNANHRREGVLMMRGECIKKLGRFSGSAVITDVAPTILYMMGLPVPCEMDGKVLLDLFADDYRTAHEVTYESSQDQGGKEKTEYSAEEEALISKRLKDLGYL